LSVYAVLYFEYLGIPILRAFFSLPPLSANTGLVIHKDPNLLKANKYQNPCNLTGIGLPVSLFICLCMSFSVSAQQSPERVNEISVLRDSSGSLRLSDIIDPKAQYVFTHADSVRLDAKSKTYWLKLSFQTTNPDAGPFIISTSRFDTAELFSPATGNFRYAVTGESIPYTDWPVAYSEFPCLAIPVTGTATTWYLRLTSATAFSFEMRNLKQIRLTPSAVFEETAHTSRYFHGIFLGIMSAMIILNLIIYLVYHARTYLVYSLFMFTQTLWHLSITGYLREFIFENAPRIARQFPFDIAAVSLLSYVFFSQVYLESKKYAPGLNNLYKWLYPVIGIVLILGYFSISLANNILLLSGLIVIIFPFFMAVIAYRKGYRPAVFFLIASFLSYISYVVLVLMSMKVLPEMFLTRYSLQSSIALQSLLFGIGLADRMNLTRRELEAKKIEKIELERANDAAIRDILEKQNEELEIKVHERTLSLEEEREKSDHLLLNILPGKIAERLKAGEEMIAEKFDDVTIFFSDFVDFTRLSKGVSPKELVSKLNEIFGAFDRLTLQYGLEKIKTIGDGYMCVCGLPEPVAGHARQVALFAMATQKELENHRHLISGEVLSMRIGIHSGTVIAGVIGSKKFAYDLWGETVNTASRMESHGVPFKIQCSEATYRLLNEEFDFEERGETAIKGIGTMRTYFLTGKK
jgi:class 3 adenylate cyclase